MSHRNHVNKAGSARAFKGNLRTTKKINLAMPMRGGIRL